jgi:serine/threonine-protein kinase
VSLCRSCRQPIADTARFCPACGTSVDAAHQPTAFADNDVTVAPERAASARPSRAPSRPRSSPPSSGRLASASGSQARFETGTILADRYRIVGRLGQGGMGEVYRADDLTLGQPVAMKFLTESLETDPARLAQLHNEVRLARQVAHKNVCRVYDVGEADGRPFLTMEYVDGEDLASLLRRIGRLPEDKGLALARQLCAGLAAAHERGVLHRDLKPANVMLDGNGDVRITDFGLAEVSGSTDQLRAGTPAYMAPEQLAGRPATIQSDLYALGLVLYEIFTGRRALTGTTIGELVQQQQQFDTAVTKPTAIVKDLTPAIERTILRTLEREPDQRPRSALSVAASLPGGDPLAAALAAGETPSPEMVAAAGERTAVAHTHAIVGAAVTLALITLAAILSPQRVTLSRAAIGKSPDVLIDRAHQVLARLGYEPRVMASHWEFVLDDDLVRYSLEYPDRARHENLFIKRPGGLLFSFRTSPRALVPLSPVGNISLVDPPFEISDMTAIVMDPAGRLLTFAAVPPQKEVAGERVVPTDWPTMFQFAGLDMARFHSVTPEWLPRGLADMRAAWEGTIPESERPLRVEAASWHGRPIYFQTIWAWTRPTRMEQAGESAGARYANVVAEVITMGLLGGALLLARRNMRAGRGDPKGAMRLATAAVFAQLIAWACNDPHVGNPSQEINRFFESLGESLFAGGVLYVMHLAVEPAMRRHWPDSLLGWTRLLRGELVDARVGRDALLGLGTGALISLLIFSRDPLNRLFGVPYPVASFGNTRYFEGLHYVVGFLFSLMVFQTVFNSMWFILTIVGLKRLFRRMWIVGIAATAAFTFLAARDLFIDAPGLLSINFTIAFIVVGILTVLAIHVGLLATVLAFAAVFALTATPWTFDTSAWYFQESALAFLVLAGLTVCAAYAAIRTKAPTGLTG